MEAHPPYHLPKGLHPSGLLACVGCASIMGWTIPLTPFLPGRGKVKRSVGYGGTSSIPPASGVAPLWTPRLRGLRFDYEADHPPNPLPGTKGENKEKRGSEGHPQTPAKGAVPLWTPPWVRDTSPCRLPVALHPSGLPAWGQVPRFTVPGSLADKRPGIPQPPVGRG